MSLDQNLSRAQHHLSVIQRALHGSDEWTATCGDQKVPVTIEKSDHGIVLMAGFGPSDTLGGPLAIYAGADLILANAPEVCSGHGFDLRWELDLKVPVAG